MKHLIVILAALSIYFMPSTAKAMDIDWNLPQRHGFTFEVGLAEGLTQSFQTPDGTYIHHVSQVGFSAPQLSLGWFLNKDTALLLRETGTSYYSEEESQSHLLTVIAPSVQQWIGNHLFVGLGIGLAAYTNDPLEFNSHDPHYGLGLNERIGFSMISERHISLALTLDLIQADFSTPHNQPETLLGGESIGLQIQYY